MIGLYYIIGLRPSMPESDDMKLVEYRYLSNSGFRNRAV